MGDSVRNNMFSGVAWSFIRQASLQVFAFVQGIILTHNIWHQNLIMAG